MYLSPYGQKIHTNLSKVWYCNLPWTHIPFSNWTSFPPSLNLTGPTFGPNSSLAWSASKLMLDREWALLGGVFFGENLFPNKFRGIFLNKKKYMHDLYTLCITCTKIYVHDDLLNGAVFCAWLPIMGLPLYILLIMST